jgi:2',3'-cyclic-nucleotide 2'-phosphodiesterase (5'-nucleotidase family)
VEPGAFGSFVGKLNLTIQNGKVIKEDYCLDEIDSKQYRASKEIDTIIKNNEKPFHDDIYKLAGYSTIPLYRYFVIENPIDTMVLDALKWGLPHIDIVLSNGFRFCPPITTPDHTGNIPITNGYIFDMLPVDSQIRTGMVTGKQIQIWLEKELNNVFAKNASERLGGWVIKFKGMHITFNAFGENGKRVQEITINGFPIDATKNYTVCACEREGDPADMICRMKGASNVKTTENTLHTVLKSYLAGHSPVTPTPQMNAKVLDASQNLLTQITGVDYQFR